MHIAISDKTDTVLNGLNLAIGAGIAGLFCLWAAFTLAAADIDYGTLVMIAGVCAITAFFVSFVGCFDAFKLPEHMFETAIGTWLVALAMFITVSFFFTL